MLESKYPSVSEEINKLWYIHMIECPFQVKRINNSDQSYIHYVSQSSQILKVMYSKFPFVWNPGNGTTISIVARVRDGSRITKSSSIVWSDGTAMDSDGVSELLKIHRIV